jgi:predicted RNA-binding Zn-ribbon protein involved in translation (DUF1610 family)
VKQGNLEKLGYWMCTKCNHSVHESKAVFKCPNCGESSLFAMEKEIYLAKEHQMNSRTKSKVVENFFCGIVDCNLSQNCFGFCSQQHFLLSRQQGVLAPASLDIEAVFAGPSGDFSVSLLSSNHDNFEYVSNRFISRWIKPFKKNGGLPVVRRIFQIRISPLIYENFKMQAASLSGLEHLFHGTSQLQECEFGRTKCPPCADKNCCVCNICRISFSMSKVKRKVSLRYGNGLYFSSVSVKSNDYSDGSEKIIFDGSENSRWRSMFLCKVVLGKPHRTKLKKLPGLPDGYNSVMGEVGPALNYDFMTTPKRFPLIL